MIAMLSKTSMMMKVKMTTNGKQGVTNISDYREFTQDEIENAANTNLVDFLTSIGEEVQKRGNAYFWIGGGYSSLTLFGSNHQLYKRFASGDSGNAIQFCREYLGMEFRESVEALLGTSFSYTPSRRPSHSSSPTEKQPFIAPNKDKSTKELYQYLSNQRGLDKGIVSDFIDMGTLYKTYELSETTGNYYSNIAFIAKDFKGIPQGALKRSLQPNGFKGNHKGSSMQQYCFRYDGISQTNSSKLFVFEAPIDMLSYITFMRHIEICSKIKNGLPLEEAKQSSHKWKNYSFLALGGVSPSPLLHYVSHKQSQGNGIDTIWLCLDNDKPNKDGRVPGIEAGIKMVNQLRDAGFGGEIFCQLPNNKDWNLDLQKAVEDASWRNYKIDDAFLKEHISNKLYHGTKESLGAILSDILSKWRQQQETNISFLDASEEKLTLTV